MEHKTQDLISSGVREAGQRVTFEGRARGSLVDAVGRRLSCANKGMTIRRH